MWEAIWKYLTPGEHPPEITDVAHPPFMQDFLAVGPAGPCARDGDAWKVFNDVSQHRSTAITRVPGHESTKPKKVLDFPSPDGGNSGVVSIATFNRHVYVGTENIQGFQVWRSTVADPARNADWVRVMSDGGGDRYNARGATVKSFKGQLYIGSISLPYIGGFNGFKGFELFRISTQDKWQLLVGDRTPAIPVRGIGARRALSGLRSGFGNPMNFYCWSLEEYRGLPVSRHVRSERHTPIPPALSGTSSRGIGRHTHVAGQSVAVDGGGRSVAEQHGEPLVAGESERHGRSRELRHSDHDGYLVGAVVGYVQPVRGF